MIVMDKLAQFPQIASRIIKEQELIIGPLVMASLQLLLLFSRVQKLTVEPTSRASCGVCHTVLRLELAP